MKVKLESKGYDSSHFYKTNMKINKNLPKVYAATLLISLLVIYIGNN